MPIVTIRGQFGSGAPEIGKLIAETLNIDYVDRGIIAEVAKNLECHEGEIVAREMPSGNLKIRILETLIKAYTKGIEGAYLPIRQMPLDDDRYFQALNKVIRNLAQSESIVIRGRGSQFILKNYRSTLHVYTIAPLTLRIKRVMNNLNLDQQAAELEIDHFEDCRRRFIKKYFNADVEDPSHYSLVINTGDFSLKSAAAIIVNAIPLK
jgi:cytidylate kinase